MNQRSKVVRTLRRAIEIILLIGLFVGGGILVPMYTAPAVFSFLPYTTPMEAQSQQVTVRLANRNLNSGESVSVTARSPAADVRIKRIRYSCGIGDIQIVYPTNQGSKQLPCGTDVIVPEQSNHELQVYTTRQSVAYLPLTITVAGEAGGGHELSFRIAISQTGIADKSQLNDRSVITFDG